MIENLPYHYFNFLYFLLNHCYKHGPKYLPNTDFWVFLYLIKKQMSKKRNKIIFERIKTIRSAKQNVTFGQKQVNL